MLTNHRTTISDLIAGRARVLCAQAILATGGILGAIIQDHRPVSLTLRHVASSAPTMPSYVPSPIPQPPSGVFHAGSVWPYAVMAAVVAYGVVVLLVAARTGRVLWPLKWLAARWIAAGPPPRVCEDCGVELAPDEAITPHLCRGEVDL